jgi:tRNA A-37 threonylcarbamoyl transferase component Bud32
MYEIEELILNVGKYKNTIIQKKFSSKKNTVCFAFFNKKPVVLKWFAPGFRKNMDNEYFILKSSPTNLNLPHIVEKDDENNVLIMSYIFGDSLCDFINSESISSNEKESKIKNLANWFYNFHTFYKKNDKWRIRGDSILHNFILSDRIWGVDFEESRLGKPTEDIASMCGSILSTNPMFTNLKFQLCKFFIKSYERLSKIEMPNINYEIAYSLLEKIQYRPDEEDILRNFSDKIKLRGI